MMNLTLIGQGSEAGAEAELKLSWTRLEMDLEVDLELFIWCELCNYSKH